MKNIIGTYSSKSNSTMVSHILVLKGDSTFNYFLRGDLVDQKGAGFWLINDDGDLILRSDDSLRPVVIDAKEEYIASNKLIEIKIIDEFESPLSFASIVLNNDLNLGFNLDEAGMSSFEINHVESISINYLGKTYNYIVNNPNANLFLLQLRLQDESRIFFDNEIWKVNGSKLTNSDQLVLFKKRE